MKSRHRVLANQFIVMSSTAVALKSIGALIWTWPHLIGWLAIVLMMMVALEEIGSYTKAIVRRHLPSLARRLKW